MPTSPTPPTPPRPTGGPTPSRPPQTPATVRDASSSPTPTHAGAASSTTPAGPAPPSTPPKLHGELDRRTLVPARTFDVLLRNGQTWHGVRLLEMDSWSLLLDVPDHGRVLLPKHAVDAYLLGR